MYIKTFGGFEIKDLKDTKFTSKEIEILVYIILKNGRTSANKIIEEIWDSSDKLPSLNNLTVYFSKINKKLKKKGFIKSKNSIVSINAKLPYTDFIEFESLSKKFFSEPSTQKLGKEAFDIYQGEFLPEISSNWVLTIRYYFEEIFFELVKLLLKTEKTKINKLSYLKKIINFGCNLDDIVTIIDSINSNNTNLKNFIDENIFELIYLKDKLLRNPRFIAITIIFENDFKILDHLRKGDFATQLSNNKFKILLELDKGKTVESEFNSFKERMKKEGAKIKKASILS
ncbi:MAG: hypothetical protein PWP54_1314 [Thermosipho sp. (in: thermotogales)]|nr:hypothetical protein [Thermosipho sp. (in: thermotogales)]